MDRGLWPQLPSPFLSFPDFCLSISSERESDRCLAHLYRHQRSRSSRKSSGIDNLSSSRSRKQFQFVEYCRYDEFNK